MNYHTYKDTIKQKILEQLNPEQQEAVLHNKGPLLILAGAGSGKTRVITYRIAYLIQILDVSADEILGVTFTNKAAEEMRQRVNSLIGDNAERVNLKTFHSLGLQIIRENYKYLGIKSNFSIYDQSAQNNLMNKIFKDLKLKKDELNPYDVLKMISNAKEKFWDPQKLYDELYKHPKIDLIYDIYKKYNIALRERNALDFADLLYYPVKLFLENNRILEYYQNRWNYIMIDEYQDTNYIQYLIINMLAERHQNIVVVGDDDQSIYSWRGARIENILEFEKDFANTKIIKLEKNYRSTNKILQLANQLIINNKRRKNKILYSLKNEGQDPQIFNFFSEIDEANFIAEEIVNLKIKYNYEDIAIFYRTNAQSRIFEQTLREKGIPYIVVGGFRFYDRKEIKDLLSYLQFLSNPFDTESFERMIFNPPKGIGEKTLEKILHIASANKTDLLSAIDFYLQKYGQNSATSKKVKELKKNLEILKQMQLESRKISEILDYILKFTKIIEFYEKSEDPENFSRIENIKEFHQSIIDFETKQFNLGKNPDLSEFLQSISLLTTEDYENIKEGSVKLMTLHNAKGLEFPIVFITGLEEGLLPHFLSIVSEEENNEESIEEERRLFYVGITRAIDKLYITYCNNRNKFGKLENKLPSRFLDEIQLSIPSKDKKQKILDNPITQDYILNQKYFHPKYGIGILIDIDTSHPQNILTLDFGNGNIKKFLANFVKLKKI